MSGCGQCPLKTAQGLAVRAAKPSLASVALTMSAPAASVLRKRGKAMSSLAMYDAWNDAVLEVMFPELEVPEPVYLDFEEDSLELLGARMGVPSSQVEAEMCAVVTSTLTHGGPAAVFERHMARTRQWVRGGRTGTPPFLATLGSFCIAAEQMAAGDGMTSANYFGRLHSVLGWDPEDRRLDHAYRRVAERLWGELNRWLIELDGQRGLPTAFVLNHRYVGLSVSQALVRRADRERLKDFFRQYGFAPGTDVAPSELAMVLDSWMSQRPCPVGTGLERLWKKGQARERIAQAAAVTLAGWDGSQRERAGGGGTAAPNRGHLVLSLEMGQFPRKRFALQALIYLPDAHVPREATVVTATPRAEVELVPDLPGALGLGRGSSLHAGDVLEGILQIEDSRSGQLVERRPRRLVLFREDELSRRWIESPQVMLGDNVRLLVHEALADRLETVLEQVARPGWKRLDQHPGQPDEWVVVAGVEIFNHPGSLVSTERMDDLAPLVPLTSSQLKIAGGFALPGQVRGKWHSWAPPEIRAVSDAAEGFEVRLVDTHRFVDDGLTDEVEETVLEVWDDDGMGVVVQALAGMELPDGDYRVELVPHGSSTALSSTQVLLRSADTPDQRQWSMLESVSYGAGIGSLGVATVSEGVVAVRGHIVTGAREPTDVTADVPPQPQWRAGQRSAARTLDSVVRLTMPDAESCLYTGRHREQIDMVRVDAQGKPLEAWSHGRCRGCGLVRRYPTRLKRSTFDRQAPAREVADTAPRHHELSRLAEPEERGRDWATAFDALLHTGGGSWSQLERIAFQIEPTALFLDQFARTLEVLGHLDIRRRGETLEPVAWEVAPTALSGTEDGFLFAGYWPASIYARVGELLEESGVSLSVDEPEDGVASYFADCGIDQLKVLDEMDDESRIPVVDRAWQQILSVLPPLSEVLGALPRQSDALVGDITWFQPRDNTWAKVTSLDSPGAYRIRKFSTTDVVRTAEDVSRGVVARSSVQLGKHLAALLVGSPLLAYDREESALLVPLGADLPGLYGRAVVAASGRPPVALRSDRLLKYPDVPLDLARHLYDLFGR